MPEIHSYGMLQLQDFSEGAEKVCCYYVMTKYQATALEYFRDLSPLGKVEIALELTVQLVGILRLVHKSGRVYNDIKPDNIMINDSKEGIRITLIDLGLAEKYADRNGGNSRQEKEFKGNILFSSLSQMGLNKTTRKDDMVALFYLCLYLMNNYRFVGDEKLVNKMCFQSTSFYDTQDAKDDFFMTKHYKETHSLENMAQLLSEELPIIDLSTYPQQMRQILERLEDQFFT